MAKPKKTVAGMEKLPSTLERSSSKAQHTWAETHDSAVGTYGEGERAHRTAFSSLKHSFEKVGDHWEEKDHRGPSDDRASDPQASDGHGQAFGGVDVLGHTKAELLDRARELGISGRSSMNKNDLAESINKANQRETARARRNS